MMEMWKWNLAFQCVVNIGVRGSETVRTRVVEADMVPVIATILDNYIKVIDKCRERAEAEAILRRRTLQSIPSHQHPHHGRTGSRGSCPYQLLPNRPNSLSENRSSHRHDRPPSIVIPQPSSPSTIQINQQTSTPTGSTADASMSTTQVPVVSPTDGLSASRLHFHHHQHHHHHHHHHHSRHASQDNRLPTLSHGNSQRGARHIAMNSLPAAVPSMDAGENSGLRPVRDIDRLPSTLPALQTGVMSQPESPTTPIAPPMQSLIQTASRRRRPSVRQHPSASGDSDDANADEAASEASGNNDNLDEPMVDIQPDVDIQEAEDQDPMLQDVSTTGNLGLNPPNVSEGQEPERFTIPHQSANDGSIINANMTPPTTNAVFPPPVQQSNTPTGTNHIISQNNHTQYLFDRSAPPGILAATPRDEDVLMSLQLLAYVSKYCNLRSYFQQSHLVPKLKIGDKLNALDETNNEQSQNGQEDEEEYLLPDDFNIFPLVEKFTVRHHSSEMQHWAGVVMRNLCRKDDARGGIRQCAYYECGRWEQWQRQFAKCRRCRRTKYCSKECQKNAWVRGSPLSLRS